MARERRVGVLTERRQTRHDEPVRHAMNLTHGFAALQHRRLPLAILIVGLGLTALVTGKLWQDESDLRAEERSQAIEEVVAAVEFRMDSYLQVLDGVSGLHDASETVTPIEFELFVMATQALDRLPGMQAIAWNRFVDADRLDAYEAEVRENQPFAGETFEVHPRTEGDNLVVEHLSPMSGNQAALGFNILSEEHRAVAAARALEEQRPIATAPIQLIQDTDNDEVTPGILLIKPTLTVGNLVDGTAVGVFRTDDLLAATAQSTGRSFVVRDLGPTGGVAEEPTNMIPSETADRDTRSQQTIDVFGRQWEISLAEGDIRGHSIAGTALGTFGGIALTLALAWMVGANQRIAKRAQAEAELLTSDLINANEELAILGSRLERGVRAAGIQLWEHNLSSGEAWSSGDDTGSRTALEEAEGLPPDLSPEEAFASDPADTERSFKLQVSPGDEDHVLDAPVPGRDQIQEQEFKLVGADGKHQWMLVRSQSVIRAGEDIVIGAHIDVTDRHEHTEIVEQLNEELTKKNQSLRDFTHVASHDLRSPLRAIVSLVGFLREDVGDLGEVAEHHLGRIEDRVGRMSRLIDDLLLYARAHSEDERRVDTDLSEVMEEILETLQDPEHLTTSVECDLPPVRVARTPLAMCIRNLVDNAYKHHGGGPGHVAVRFKVQDQLLKIEVADDGVGIDPDHIDKIFEPFRRLRVDESTPGSGIGLSVIERAADAHGGSIDVRSTHGLGTTFTLWWPYQRPEQANHKSSRVALGDEPTERGSGSGEPVLSSETSSPTHSLMEKNHA